MEVDTSIGTSTIKAKSLEEDGSTMEIETQSSIRAESAPITQPAQLSFKEKLMVSSKSKKMIEYMKILI